MELRPTPISDLWIIQPNIWKDNRGYFFESYNNAVFQEKGLSYQWVQDNEAFSNLGVVRGLHYQTGAFAQAKLVRVVTGRVLDIAVDLRPNSETYGQYFSVELSEDNKLQLLIPRGFAHGYQVLEDHTIFAYKCDNYYNQASEGGIRIDDPTLNIKWADIEGGNQLSEKDKSLPFFPNHKPVL